MRTTNVEKIFYAYTNGSVYYNKSDKLRLDENNRILDNGTPIGQFEEAYNEETDSFDNFLILTLQDFKSQPSWKNHKRQLALEANKQGFYVLFVPIIDIGFGINSEPMYLSTSLNSIANDLLKVAKYSQDEDIKTACIGLDYENQLYVYTYNQLIFGEIEHAEQVLVKYLRNLSSGIVVYSLLEPCVKCIKALRDAGAYAIWYAYPHKAKWNTYLYIQLTNDIWTKRYLAIDGMPMTYNRLAHPKIDKFYNKEKK